jgi:hypothetical protein
MFFFHLSRTSVLSLVVAFAPMVGCTTARQSETARLGKLGAVEFPTTCSVVAQSDFIRGLAALHSFWYPVALEQFRAATRTDPNCMMGYWGEAMAHNHPIWGDPQETEAARKIIEKIRITQDLTPRERAYLNAVKILYGEGAKAARDKAYAAAMEKIYLEYPNYAEAALFYALALMGSARPDDAGGLQTRLRAGEIASEVFKKKPNHPGAAHYVIHTYDDPKHAHLALTAARRYAEIAPAAPHALHMSSHIFLQLGMWPETAASNKESWEASDRWVKQNNLPISERDYHSLHWLQYAYLQQGRNEDARKLLGLIRQSLADFPKDDMRNLMYGTYLEATMAAAYLIATQQWDAAEEILGPVQTKTLKEPTRSDSNPYEAFAVLAQTPAIFARGLAAAMKGSPQAHESFAALQAISQQQTKAPIPFVAELREAAGIQALEISAAAHAMSGKLDAAIKIMERAALRVDAMPPSPGPPTLIKPVHELFGEILLRAGKPERTSEQFATTLRRHPNRARSLLGAARAAAQSGETQRAAKFYAQFVQQWEQAETQLPELREARNYVKRVSAR